MLMLMLSCEPGLKERIFISNISRIFILFFLQVRWGAGVKQKQVWTQIPALWGGGGHGPSLDPPLMPADIDNGGELDRKLKTML